MDAPLPPIIFLAGPPGAGKSTLGSRACNELGLRFLDLATVLPDSHPEGDFSAHMAALSRVVAEHAADVIELPWDLQQERQALVLARKSGVCLLLWAHPEDMQARSGHDEPLFTPVPRLKIRGGFGRTGSGCREFRHLNRACDETLLLVDCSLEEAAEAVKECISEIRTESEAPPAEREGLTGWAEDWRIDHDASPRVSKVIIDAMARYLEHLRAHGTSPRKLSGVCSDLNAAGHLVLMYDAPRGKRILDHFNGPPWEPEFEHKFSDSPTLVARYRRNLEGFARFLKENGDLPKDDEDAESSREAYDDRSP